MKDERHILFCKGNHYYFGVGVAPRADQTVLDYDSYIYRGISDGQFTELEFVEREGRIGIFVLTTPDDTMGEYLYEAESFPFIYDEVWMPAYTGGSDVFMPVRIGKKWGVLRLTVHGYDVRFRGWCVDWNYDSREEAIQAIRAPHDDLLWTPAFCEHPFSYGQDS